MPTFIPAGNCARISGNGRADLLDDFQRVRGGQDPDAHEGRVLAVEANILVVGLSAKHDVGDFTQANDGAVVLLDDEIAKIVGRAQVGVRDQVHRHHRALGLAQEPTGSCYSPGRR